MAFFHLSLFLLLISSLATSSPAYSIRSFRPHPAAKTRSTLGYGPAAQNKDETMTRFSPAENKAASLTGYSTAAYKTTYNIGYGPAKPPPYYYGPADATFSPAKNKAEAESLTGYITAAYKTAYNIGYGPAKPPAAAATP